MLLNTICLTVLFCALVLVFPTSAQTRCSLMIPVPDLGFCDAIGALEEHVDADLNEARGRMNVMREYEHDVFRQFNQQFTEIQNHTGISDLSIDDIDREISTLKRFVDTLLEMQTRAANAAVNNTSRVKRASSLPPAQQQLVDAAQQTFHQALAGVINQIQAAATTVADDATKDKAFHAKLQLELTSNQRALQQIEQQIHALDAAIQNALSQKKTVTGVSLAGVQQEVTDLLINASVAEQVSQRQLDFVEKTLKQWQQDEAKIGSDISNLQPHAAALSASLNNDEQDIIGLIGAEQILESSVDAALNKSADFIVMATNVSNAKGFLTQAGAQLFNLTLGLGPYEGDLKSQKASQSGLESLVSFSSKAQTTMSTDILMQKKNISDDIALLKFAFGLQATHP
ncbi:uncharacterized protein LOC127879252 [Dreissena polymorpha]|uniref:Uncharacterized protein n=1 Tax=Dreissena polymorpha TaxID=45954 RepID=A0A9D4K612_DREPO|nr:uncharacterized protein LOC127879252 [Dreissena polymorpha]KAH3833722.1 hypothetical protein DPMN_107035 [Dreissena polymorpha]